MKVCIITSSYPLNPSDAEAAAGLFVRDFALALYEAGCRVFIVTQSRKGAIEDAPGITVMRYRWLNDGRPLSRLNPANPVDLFKIFTLIHNGAKEVLRLIQREKINFCLAMWAVPSGYLAYYARRKAGTPYAVYALGSDIWDYGKNPIFKPTVRKILRGAKRLFADGIVLSKEVEKLSGRQCSFLASSRLFTKALRALPIDATKRNFLFIGRYHKNKGVDVLLEAIRLIPENAREKINFFIFGGGNLECLLKTKIREYDLGNFVFLGGFITPQESADYLSACDCVIIPSRIESIPLILSDSLRMNKPVIVTDAGDMGRLVKEYAAGKAVAANNPEELKDAILEFSQEDTGKYATGIQRLKDIFDIRKNALRLLETMEAE